MKKTSGKLYGVICLLLITSLLFSYKLNSICIMALLLVWLLEGGFALKFRQLVREPFFILNALLLVLYLFSILQSEDKATARFFVEKNLSLVILPMVLLSKKRFTEEEFFLLGKGFVAGTAILMTTATLCAIRNYFVLHDSDVFFYHKLSEPVGKSAIVTSLFCIISLAWLFYLPRAQWKIFMGILLAIWLLLLNSKLFIAALALMLLFNLAGRIAGRTRALAGLAVAGIVAIVLLTPNPLRKRFAEIGQFRRYYLTAPDFNEGIYFDGLSLRLVFIRFGLEIMNEKKSYWFGTGTGDAETLLQEKIKAYHMYQGDGITDKQGYLQYGYHNEFLQKYVQLGIAGLSVFIGLLAYGYYLALRYRQWFLFNLLLIFTFTFFTDTLLEQQVGLVLFLAFACMAIAGIRQRQEEVGTAGVAT
jgi:O-antigen ligase